MKKIIFGILILLVFLAVAWLFLSKKPESKEIIVTNFKECVEAGYAVMESYPRQCRAEDGKIFAENIGNELEKIDLIKVENPRPNQEITSPMVIKGEARGYWFFEASFPIRLFDANGTEIGLAIAQAIEEWMTEDFVPFEVNLEFINPETKEGILVLEKDNPSGLPENDDKLIIPIKFGEISNNGLLLDECITTGCSGQICSDEEVVTTCEWQEKYSCYQTAECKRQANGQCGWTQTEELLACLN